LARQLLAQLDRLRSQVQGSGFLQSNYYVLKGRIALADGDAPAAVRSERAALVYFPPAHEAVGILGQAYADERNWPEAARAFRRYLDFHGEFLYHAEGGEWVVAHLELAGALAAAGQTAEALRYYNEFLRLWSGADPGLPLIEQARGERDRLNGASPAARKTASDPGIRDPMRQKSTGRRNQQ
jgi:tetratricopeptide (TPR) repeat protein